MYNIEEIHQELLVLLKIFDDVCVENDIKYSLHGGTLLGAVREKGFIPWDDDADVSLSREEYNKLWKCLYREEYNNIQLDYNSDRVVKLKMSRKNKPKVWIDIFIYDYISSNIIEYKLKQWILILSLGLVKSDEIFELSKLGRYTGWKYIVVYILHRVGRVFSLDKRLELRKYFSEYCLLGDKKYVVRSNDQYKALHEILPARVIEKYICIPFENINLMVSAEYDLILRKSYGDDYMIPKRDDDYHADEHALVREKMI